MNKDLFRNWPVMNYESHIHGDKPVIIQFFADWCPPRRLMTPIFHEVKARVGERVTILNVDVECEPELAKLYNIQTLPTIAIFHRGRLIWRKNGIATAHEMLEHIQMIID